MKLDELVNRHYDKLNHNDLYIWKYICANKDKCVGLTIDELAERCNVSRSTILRFAQKLSLKGYSELKIHLRWELEGKNEIEKNCIDKVCNDFKQGIEELRNKDFTMVCKKIYNSKRIFVYGTGAVQHSVAREIQRIFLSGYECIYNIQGEAETNMLLNTATTEDIVIIISLTGGSNHVVEFAKKLKIGNVPIISVTKLRNNELARLSDENLYINTSMVNIGTDTDYEVTALFFILVEMLFLKYSIYKDMMKELSTT